WRDDAAIAVTGAHEAAATGLPRLVRDAPDPAQVETAAPSEPLHVDRRPFLIAGSDATLSVTDEGNGAALAHVARWRRPRRRPRRRVLFPPPRPFANHVDREPELAALSGAIKTKHAVNVYGDRAIGKTHVLVELLGGRDAVFLDGRGQAADDLLHTLF